MPADDLKKAESHFAFGKNWSDYARTVGEPEIAEAVRGLERLVPARDLEGRSFLDIGCGSGLHALAAARLGVSRILALDIDADSVATTRDVLTRHEVKIPWRAETVSVFDLSPATQGQFDVVYSWGVLHHTGAMWEAVAKASAMVTPGGLFIFALYRTTHMDPFWVAEKCWYAKAPEPLQKLARGTFMGAFAAAYTLKGGNFRRYVEGYKSARGMSWSHDVHDWLGGYPYETALPHEVEALLRPLGFEKVREFARGKTVGLFGSGCDEFVYRRRT